MSARLVGGTFVFCVGGTFRYSLTEIEQSEYDRYLAAFHFVTILQARARRFIQS